MVAAAINSRPHVSTPPEPITTRRTAGTWVIIGVPVLLLMLCVWQVGSGMLRTEIAIRDAVAVSRVSLEADPAGSRIDFVLVELELSPGQNAQRGQAGGQVTEHSRSLGGRFVEAMVHHRAASVGDLFQDVGHGLLVLQQGLGRIGVDGAAHVFNCPPQAWMMRSISRRWRSAR